ncbi:MAG: nucleotide exchange factor GrpE [Microgenomates group bacterium]
MDKKRKNTEVEELKKQLEELKKNAEEFKNKYLRALADYQNLEKRVNEEKKEIISLANKNLILKLLPFLDTLDKAEIFVKDQGLKMAKEQIWQVLKEYGLKELNVLDKPFDPNIAEAVDIVTGEKDNWVVEVLRKGYKLADKILRVAQVKVSKKL